MRARFGAPVGVFLLLLTAFTLAAPASGQYQTANFVVYAPQPAMAKQVGDLAEKYRKELAELWLGEALPQWPQPCPITVEIDRHAGGETSFAFSPGPDGRSQPFDWRMKIYGPPNRILDSVLPHEVTHTIFATHYGRPLPRWADEGACTTVEHEAEKKKSHAMLMDFLRTGKGIPFNHLFAMKQYPRDILPLYAQGHSLARFLIMQKGHKHFVNFVGEGMQLEQPGQIPQTWNQVTKKYYGYDDLSDLQISWLGWVKKGSPTLIAPAGDVSTAVAQADVDSPVQDTVAAPVALATTTGNVHRSSSTSDLQTLDPSESWYVRQSRTGGSATMQRPNTELLRGDSTAYAPGSVNPANSPTQISESQNRVWR